jgi:hypothetical protein
LIGSLHLTALLDWELPRNLSQALGAEPSTSKLSFQQNTGHPRLWYTVAGIVYEGFCF